MTITIQRMGGFAGLAQNLASADLTKLPPAVAEQLRKLVAKLSELSLRQPGSEGADQFHYQVEIAEGGAKPRIISVVDAGDPNEPAMQTVSSILKLLGASPG